MRRVRVAVAVGVSVVFVVAVAAIARGEPTVPATPKATAIPEAAASGAPSASSGSSRGDQSSILFGASGQYEWEIRQREEELGKPVEAVRVYRRWDERLFDDDQIWARDTGHTIFLSIKSRRDDGSKIKWRDIADAEPGDSLRDEMLRQARQIKDFGADVYLIFNHEPDAKTSRPMGEPADFVAAWRTLIDTYREARVTNARYVWVLTEWAFRSDARVADAYYPGDGYVDHIGVDAYNWLGCATEDDEDGRWRSPATILEGHRRFGEQHPDKGLMVLEWGTVEDPDRPGRKARWIRNAARLLQKPGWEQYRAVVHYDARSLEEPHSPCEWDYRTSPSALAAWRDMGNLPAYGADSPGDIENPAREPLDSVTGD